MAQPASLMDMFSGKAPLEFSPRDYAGNQIGMGDAIAQNSNALVGLGMGLLQPRSLAHGAPVSSAWGDALQGYQAGSVADSRRGYQQAQLQHQKAQAARQAAQFGAQQARQAREDAYRREQDTRTYGLQERKLAEDQRQFDVAREPKPSIHWTADRTDEKGDTIPGKPYLVSPNGSYRELTLEGVQNLAPSLPQTGAVPGRQSSVEPQSGDEGAIPPSATLAQAAPAELPLNRTKAIDAYSTETGKAAAKSNEKQEAGSKVISLIDRLISKTQHPDDPKKDNPLFAEAAGPMHEAASGQPIWSPLRLGYEYSKLGPSKEAQSFLGQIKSDAQAINSELQRAYLSGQGAVTENERTQISDILGRVAAARSPKEARDLLNNAKGIIAVAMQKGYATPGEGPSREPAAAPPNARPAAPVEPHPNAIKVLRAAPHRAKEFDAKYGAGAAARYLNEM